MLLILFSGLLIAPGQNRAWATLTSETASKPQVKPQKKAGPTKISKILKSLLFLTLYAQGASLPASTSSLASSPNVTNSLQTFACSDPNLHNINSPAFALSELIDLAPENGAAEYHPSQVRLKAEGMDFTLAQLQAISHLSPGFKSIRPLKKAGINAAFEVTDRHGKKQFLKLYTDEEAEYFNSKTQVAKQFPSLHEAASSNLASYLTGGLVPAGTTSGGEVILFPMMEMDEKSTQNLFQSTFPNFRDEDIYPKLTFQQKEQLLSHLIADLLLESDDTHPGNFGVDEHGNLLAFDKGRSHYKNVVESNRLKDFDLKFDHIETSNVYKKAIEHLKNNPEELKRLLQTEDVQDTLHRAELLGKHPEELRQRMSPFLTYLKRRAEQTGGTAPSFEVLEKSYIQRFQGVRSGIAKYFGLSSQELAYSASHQEPATVLNYRHEIAENIELDTLEFDPRKYQPKLKAPIEKGIPGDRVSNIVQKSKALAGINGGFYSFGDGAGLVTWLKYKAANKLGMSHNPAFPSAILKTKDHLLSDTMWTTYLHLDGLRMVLTRLLGI